MPTALFHALTQAIDGRHLVTLVDEAGSRVIEPYLIFESAAGDMLLHGWQRSGAYRSAPPPRWCNLHLGDIASVEVQERQFGSPRPDYNPHRPQFHRLIYELGQAAAPASSRSGAARHPRPRRSPPDTRNGRPNKLPRRR